MDTFNFPYHQVKTVYPTSGDSMQFGNSYEFTSRPRAPDQRTFVLTFAGMKYFLLDDQTADTSTLPLINYRLFQQFYEAHGTWDIFIYPHPLLGNINVRFSAPLADPDGYTSGNGAVKPFEVQLREQP